MLNTADIEALVKQQISESVNSEVLSLLDKTSWFDDIEKTIIDYAQQRIVAKFNNSNTMDQILSTIETSIQTLFKQGSLGIKELVPEEDLKRVINSELDRSVSEYVAAISASSEWVQSIKSQVIATFVRNLSKELNSVGIDSIVKEQLVDLFDQYAKTIQFNGIDDRSDVTELTVLDGAVVVEHDLVATNIQAVESLTTETLSVHGDLIVKGNINTDALAWKKLSSTIQNDVYNKFIENSKKSLIDDIIAYAQTTGIDFAEVRINGTMLVSGETLSPKITNSNLHEVGQLKELTVLGEADFNNTAFVANKRLGINTREPSSALSVWDEEVEIAVGKRSERTGFIGTNRKQNLEIGVNGKGNIAIADDGLVTIDRLQVGKYRVMHSDSLPGFKGNKGDIVFNINVSEKDPTFAWMCIGGFNWLPLKTLL